MKYLRFLLLLLLLPLAGSFSTEPAKGYASDFMILVRTLEDLHPLLYRVTGKQQFEAHVTDARNKLMLARSRNEAMYIIQSFLFKLGDSHASTLNAFSEPGGEKILPFKITILDRKMYIKRFPADSTWVGAEVQSINGTPAATLIDSLNIFYTNDGARNIVGKGLSSLFNSLYAAFCRQPDTFRIITDRGVLKTTSLRKGENYFDELIAYKWFDGKKRYLESSTGSDPGYFFFEEFESKSGGFRIEKEFDHFMNEMISRKKQAVIIDLRYNSGGAPAIAARMASYFLDTVPPIMERVFLTTTRKPEFFEYVQHHYIFLLLHAGTIRRDSILEKTRFEPVLKKPGAHKIHYEGKVYIITSALTTSAATMFCAYLSKNRKVTFVGAETCGGINYFWAHKHCDMQLPNSGIRLTFPMELIELEKGSSDTEQPRGLIPGKKITYSIEEYLSGADKEMEWIKQDANAQH